jgi:hypothetical protein
MGLYVVARSEKIKRNREKEKRKIENTLIQCELGRIWMTASTTLADF